MAPGPRRGRRPVALALLAVLACPPGWSRAGEGSDLDVVLLVDTSGSMLKTDPQGLRRQATALFVSLLDPRDRVALVVFDRDARVLVPLTSLDDAGRERLLEATRQITTSGRHTNLDAAVATGFEVLGPAGAPRRRLLVLLTDGQMDVDDAETSQRLATALRERAAGPLADAEVLLYGVAFTAGADAGLLAAIAGATGGFSSVAADVGALHRSFSQIYESVAGPDQLPVRGDAFSVDDGIERMTIVIDKTAPGEALALETPDGHRYTRDAGGAGVRWTDTPAFALILVERPVAGTWRLQPASGNQRAYVVTDLRLQGSLALDEGRAGQPIVVNAWLYRDGARFADPTVLEKINVIAEFRDPAGRTIATGALHDDGLNGDTVAADAVFATLFRPPSPGHYRVHLTADGVNFERGKVLDIEIEGGEILAGGGVPAPARLNVRSPAAEAAARMAQAQMAEDQAPGATRRASSPSTAAAPALVPAPAPPPLPVEPVVAVEPVMATAPAVAKTAAVQGDWKKPAVDFLIGNAVIAALAGAFAGWRFWRRRRLAGAWSRASAERS